VDAVFVQIDRFTIITPMQPSAFNPIRVLVADDSRMMREIIAKIFKYEAKLKFVGEAEDYFTLFECVEQSKPDVVLLDVHMPGRLEFSASVIKSRLSGIPVLCMSIWQDEVAYRLAREFGCDLIDKATLQHALVPAIEAAIRSKSN